MIMRCGYDYNQENNNYIMIKLGEDLKPLITSDEVDSDTKKFLISNYNEMYHEQSYVNDVNAFYKEPAAIPINSELGMFITSRDDLFYCKKEELTYKKIGVSYLIATLEEEPKLANKIRYFLKDKITGIRSDLIKNYDQDIIDYMLVKGSLDIFGEKQDEYEKPKVYGVYENGQYMRRCLVEEQPLKQKK